MEEDYIEKIAGHGGDCREPIEINARRIHHDSIFTLRMQPDKYKAPQSYLYVVFIRLEECET